MTSVDLSHLDIGDRLGKGGQGSVYHVRNRKINDRWPVVYKEYLSSVLPTADIEALRQMVNLVSTLPPAQGEWLCETTAWPAALVEKQGQVSGFLMRAVPDQFRFLFQTLGASAATTKLATVEFLLNDDKYVGSVGLRISERDRVMLLHDLAETLNRLHQMDISVGDLSPKNLLFTLTPQPECFLIDCDAVRLRGITVLPQAETPDWQLPAGEELATRAGDAYKFALLAVRMFARDQTSTDPVALSALSPALGDLARAGLDPDAARRPGPAHWTEGLVTALASASTVTTTPNTIGTIRAQAGRPGQGIPPNGPGRATTMSKRGWVAAALACALVLVVAMMAANQHSTSTAQPLAAPTTNDQPWIPPTTSDVIPTPTPSSFDPNSLNDASTDQMPFTANSLLPQTFTDSNDIRYAQTAGGEEPCVQAAMTSNIQTALNENGCVRNIAGTYDYATPTASGASVLISVQVFAFATASSASAAYGALGEAVKSSSWDFGFWCPRSGAGSSACANHSYESGAGWVNLELQYRFVVEAYAIWSNFSRDTSYDNWLRSAATAATTDCGPNYYVSQQN